MKEGTKEKQIGFEAYRAGKFKIIVLWVIMSSTLVYGYPPVGGTFYLVPIKMVSYSTTGTFNLVFTKCSVFHIYFISNLRFSTIPTTV
jgi:hypothetical protein